MHGSSYVKSRVKLDEIGSKLYSESAIVDTINKDSIVKGWFNSVEYINLTEQDIFIQDRLGVVNVIPTMISPLDRRMNNEFRRDSLNTILDKNNVYILYTFNVHIKSLDYIISQYEEMIDLSNIFWNILNKLKEERVKIQGNRHRRSTITITTLTKISANRLKDSAYYVSEYGISLSFGDHIEKLHKVMSLNELQKVRCNVDNIASVTQEDPANVMVKAIFKPGNKRADKLYIKLLDKVQEVPVIEDPNIDFEGIYIYHKRDVDSDKPYIVKLSLNEAILKYGISTNIIDASRKDEIDDKLWAREDKEADRELKRLQNELQNEKLKTDKLILEHKDIEREHELTLMRMRRKSQKKEDKFKEWKMKLEAEESNRKLEHEQIKREYEERMTVARTLLEEQKTKSGLLKDIFSFIQFAFKLVPTI